MASFYHTFTATRQTEPDLPSLLSQLRGSDPSAGIQHLPGGPYTIKKDAGDWTPAQITGVQNILNTAPASSPQLDALAWASRMPLEYQGLVLALVDAINLSRTQPTQAFPAVTAVQAVQAIRDKIATLT